ncbi:hypothetical protein ACQEVF_36735 [Nonomuraea polychroma]|uniref:hypothetical protein n=1 Tax=Nonomuraea polychroma TaxID=46176 RepID=UPI003D8BCAF1
MYYLSEPVDPCKNRYDLEADQKGGGLRVPLADRAPRPVGIGRTADGRYRFVVPLRAGEPVSAFEVLEHQTRRPVWKVSQPTRPDTRQGTIVLGESGGFTQQAIPLELPLPSNIAVSADVPDAPAIGRGFLLDEVPEDLADTDQVIDFDGRRVSEEEFRQQVTGEYC